MGEKKKRSLSKTYASVKGKLQRFDKISPYEYEKSYSKVKPGPRSRTYKDNNGRYVSITPTGSGYSVSRINSQGQKVTNLYDKASDITGVHDSVKNDIQTYRNSVVAPVVAGKVQMSMLKSGASGAKTLANGVNALTKLGVSAAESIKKKKS